MNKIKVIDKFSANRVNIEVYSDGDCLIEVVSPGFFQLTAKTLERISSSRINGGVLNKDANPTPGQAKSCAKTATVVGKSLAPESAEIRRSVAACGPSDPVPSAWKCVIKVKDCPSVEHLYKSRTLARQGAVGTPIGMQGRLA